MVGLIFRNDLGALLYMCSPCKKRFPNHLHLKRHISGPCRLSAAGRYRRTENQITHIENIKLEPGDGIEYNPAEVDSSTYRIVNFGTSTNNAIDEGEPNEREIKKEVIDSGNYDKNCQEDSRRFHKTNEFPTSTAYIEVSSFTPEFDDEIVPVELACIIEAPSFITAAFTQILRVT